MKIKLSEYMEYAKKICKKNNYDYEILRKLPISYNDDDIYFLISPNKDKVPSGIKLDHKVQMIKVLRIINDIKGFKYEVYNDEYIK